jgi:hypothetical protein
VDKHTVYGSICGSKNDRICLTQCWDDPQGYCPGGCKEYVLADPVKYAKLETQAARVTELEAAIAKKDEALWLAYTAFDRKCSRCRNAEDDGETCFKVLTCPTGIAHRAVYTALSLTPAGKGERGEERKS